MPVRAVTPRIPALHGHTYVHARDCAGDCCNHDLANDLLTTGEDIYDPEWPDKPLRLRRHTPSQTSAANPPAGDPGVDLLGGGLSGSTLGQPGSGPPSSPLPGSEPQDVSTRSRGHASGS